MKKKKCLNFHCNIFIFRIFSSTLFLEEKKKLHNCKKFSRIIYFLCVFGCMCISLTHHHRVSCLKIFFVYIKPFPSFLQQRFSSSSSTNIDRFYFPDFFFICPCLLLAACLPACCCCCSRKWCIVQMVYIYMNEENR